MNIFAAALVKWLLRRNIRSDTGLLAFLPNMFPLFFIWNLFHDHLIRVCWTLLSLTLAYLLKFFSFSFNSFTYFWNFFCLFTFSTFWHQFKNGFSSTYILQTDTTHFQILNKDNILPNYCLSLVMFGCFSQNLNEFVVMFLCFPWRSLLRRVRRPGP